MAPLHIENKGLIPEKFRRCFKRLAEQIKDMHQVDILQPLTGGFSDSVPLLTYSRYEHGERYQVFKIGDKGLITTEAGNWETFIRRGPFPGHHVVNMTEGPITGASYGLIVYDFVGEPGKKPQTFEDYYQNRKDPDEFLNTFFESVLKTASINSGRDSRPIQNMLQTHPSNVQKIENEVIRLHGCGNITGFPKIRVQGAELRNPLYFYPFNNVRMPVNAATLFPTGIVHGDLNAKNILFYNSVTFPPDGQESTQEHRSIPCMIDYAHTGQGPLYTDIAKMESVLKFQLLDIEKVRPADLFKFEYENILPGDKGSVMTQENPAITDADLHKLFACIKVLREVASKVINNNNDPLAYWLMLYKNTLAHIRYEDINDSRKRYAFCSAAIILTRYLT